MGQTMAKASYSESYTIGSRTCEKKFEATGDNLDACRDEIKRRIQELESATCSANFPAPKCKPQPNVTVLREELENAQARVLKLEVWAKSAFWYITTGDRDEGTIALDVNAVLGDIKAIKKLLAGAINDLNRDCEDDSEED